MARKLSTIIVVDVESTCWETDDQRPKGQSSEIIEIGIVTVELNPPMEISSTRGILVKPQYSSVSKFCTDLTGITQQDVDNHGIQFSEACKFIRDNYDTRNLAWASYGDYDRVQFEKDCRNKYCDYPFGITHLNVKNLFALAYRLQREVGMAQALEFLGLPLEGSHHRAGDDAKNIAKLLINVMQRLKGGIVTA